MSDPLEGINAKLKRAHENIVNLEMEAARFFQSGEHPIIGDDNLQAISDAVKHLSEQGVPPRFAVLAGEIIHHFRSCLDHIAWQLSISEIRSYAPERIEFPIYSRKPDKNKASRYDAKIRAIASPKAREIVEGLQPYNRTNPLDDSLWIVHDMDRFDKHRELVIVQFAFGLKFPPHLNDIALRYTRPDAGPIPLSLAVEIQKYVDFAPAIAFRQFGERENQPVIASLLQLENVFRRVAELFRAELESCSAEMPFQHGKSGE